MAFPSKNIFPRFAVEGSIQAILFVELTEQMSSTYNPRKFLEQFSGTGLPEFARTLLPAGNAPKLEESAVVALQCPRTAALCFDRVWSIPLDETECPAEIAFSAVSDAELVAALWLHSQNEFQTTLKGFSEYDEVADAIKRRDAEAIVGRPDYMAVYLALRLGLTLTGSIDSWRNQPIQSMGRTLSESLRRMLQRTVVPVYGTKATCDAEYRAGEHEVVLASLRQLEVVDEGALSWEQVLEFRSDAAAKADYRRLVHWLDRDMVGRSYQYVIDEIGVRLENYRTAIRKHGLRSRIGVLASVLEAKALLPASVAAGGSIVAGEPLWGALVAGGVLLGKVLVAVGQSRVDLQEIREEHQEVAFVTEINERLTNP